MRCISKVLPVKGHHLCSYRAGICFVGPELEVSAPVSHLALLGLGSGSTLVPYQVAMNRLMGRLKLKINQEKSAVAKAWERKFLGYRKTCSGSPIFKQRVRELTNRSCGRSMEQIVGWKNYFNSQIRRGILRPGFLDSQKTTHDLSKTVETKRDRASGDGEQRLVLKSSHVDLVTLSMLLEDGRHVRNEHRLSQSSLR